MFRTIKFMHFCILAMISNCKGSGQTSEMTSSFSLYILTIAYLFHSSFAFVLQTTKTEKLTKICKVVYLSWPRCYILLNVLLARRFTLIPNRYILGLIIKTFVSHPDFKCISIQCTRKFYTKPKDLQIIGYLLTKQVNTLTASLSLKILKLFGSSISKSLAGGIEISLYLYKIMSKETSMDTISQVC